MREKDLLTDGEEYIKQLDDGRDNFAKEISEESFLAVWADYCRQKEELVDQQAEIDEYKAMLNMLITYTVIPDSVVKEIKDLMFGKER